MRRLWSSVVEPVLSALQPRVIVEIGAGAGENSRHLLRFCRQRGSILHIVDPRPGFDLDALPREYRDLMRLHRDSALNALPRIGPIDAVLEDGDHNWYTVYHELTLLDRLAKDQRRPFPATLLHDVGWPYGRRDLYYDPARIPASARHRFAQEGMLPGRSTLQRSDGFNAHLRNACEEGTARNGVLTALEDFLHERTADFRVSIVPAFHGIAVVLQCSLLSDNPALAEILKTLTLNAAQTSIIEELESGRLQAEVSLARVREQLRRLRRRVAVLEAQTGQYSTRLVRDETLGIRGLHELTDTFRRACGPWVGRLRLTPLLFALFAFLRQRARSSAGAGAAAPEDRATGQPFDS